MLVTGSGGDPIDPTGGITDPIGPSTPTPPTGGGPTGPTGPPSPIGTPVVDAHGALTPGPPPGPPAPPPGPPPSSLPWDTSGLQVTTFVIGDGGFVVSGGSPTTGGGTPAGQIIDTGGHVYVIPAGPGTGTGTGGSGTPTTPPSFQPYWAWTRFESRPRSQDFNNNLKAAIHDPLWMLGRQWQMGEFTGMDSGSGILARIQVDYQKIEGINIFTNASGMTSSPPPQAYAQEKPLEPIVEAIPYNWSIKERILMGKKWLYFVKRHTGPDTASPPASPYTDFLNWFRNGLSYPHGFVLEVSEPYHTLPDDKVIAGADIFSDNNVRNFVSATALSDYDIDGAAIYKVLASGSSITSIIASTSPPMPVAAIESDFQTWVEKMYSIPKNENWQPSSMDYQFETLWGADSTSPSDQYRLFARNYRGGHFDWHAFVQDTTSYSVSGLTPDSGTFFQQMILSESHFPGMPNSRWWEFEDGHVNFCNLDADPTDMAKVVLTQFALIFQDDWFLVPVKLPVGSYSEVRGVLVTDVFGVNTFISNYSRNGASSSTGPGGLIDTFSPSPPMEWKSWRWLDVSMKDDIVNHTYEPAGHLILTPVVNKILESKPVESVLFMRDELADLVWGIEKIVPDKLGKGKDGLNTVSNFLEYLKKLRFSGDIDLENTPDPAAKLSYKLEVNPVPENWIPFIPVHVSPPANNNRLIQYQRAAMPRIIDQYGNSLIRPRTEILNYGLRSVSAASPPDTSYTGADLFPQSYGITPQSYQPLYINEEEIPKEGTIVQTTFKRARWYDGKIVNWVGRRRITGIGEGNSGLAFDTIKNLNT